MGQTPNPRATTLQGFADAALLSRVRDELAGIPRHHRHRRCCPRCGRPIRAGQPITHIFGTAVHQRCDAVRPVLRTR